MEIEHFSIPNAIWMSWEKIHMDYKGNPANTTSSVNLLIIHKIKWLIDLFFSAVCNLFSLFSEPERMVTYKQ